MSNDPANFQPPDIADPINPYAPTVSGGAVTPDLTDAENLRRTYLNHEASVKSIGTLYLLAAIFWVPIGLSMLAPALFLEGGAANAAMLIIGFLYLGIGLLQGYAGLGLRRLTNAGRIFGIVFGIIGLIGVPIGTLISIYILYLLISQKGKVVFSDTYRQAIAQTPHIKYKTSIVVWILLGLVLLLVGIGLVGILLG